MGHDEMFGVSTFVIIGFSNVYYYIFYKAFHKKTKKEIVTGSF